MFARPEGAFPQPVLKMFREVRARMPLDYLGMDFGLTPDGEAVLFEANATMSFFPSWRTSSSAIACRPHARPSGN